MSRGERIFVRYARALLGDDEAELCQSREGLVRFYGELLTGNIEEGGLSLAEVDQAVIDDVRRFRTQLIEEEPALGIRLELLADDLR